MKKRITILMSILLLWTVAACGAGTKTAPAPAACCDMKSNPALSENPDRAGFFMLHPKEKCGIVRVPHNYIPFHLHKFVTFPSW